MIEVGFSNSFKKAFHKKIERNQLLETTFWSKLKIFIESPFSIELKTHKLSGKLQGYWSFSIEYDCRVVFFFTNDNPKKVVFTDIGSHDEVY